MSISIYQYTLDMIPAIDEILISRQEERNPSLQLERAA